MQDQSTSSPASLGMRSLGEVVMEVRFAIEYGGLHERFWSHIDTTATVTQIIFGALALAGVMSGGTTITAIAGLVLAAVSGLQIGFKPRERAFLFRDTRRKLHDLNAKAWDMDVRPVEAELERIRSEAPQGFEAFIRPAENRVLQTEGYADRVKPLTRGESALLMLA